MKTETRIRELSIRLIQILVLFEVLWAAVFLVGLTFKWSGLTDQLTSAFFAAGFCSLILITALAILNVAANLNIISEAAEGRGTLQTQEPVARRSYWPLLVVAGALVAFVVGGLAIAETRLYRAKKSEAELKIESVVDTPLLASALEVIKRDGKVSELRDIREALAAAIQAGNRVSLLMPREFKGVRAYYELTGWWWGGKDDDKISAISLPRFSPSVNEAEEFAALIAGKIDRFSLKAGSEIRSFRRVVKPEGEIIILIDTNRQYGDRKFSS
jgi:hypothetical protein